MPELLRRTGWPRIGPLLAFLIVIFAVVTGIQNGTPSGATFTELISQWSQRLASFASSVIGNAGAALLVAFLLLETGRARPLVWITFTLIAANLAAEFTFWVIYDRNTSPVGDVVYSLWWTTYNAVNSATLIMLIGLHAFLPPRHLLQHLAILSIIVAFGLQLLNLTPLPGHTLRDVAYFIAVVTSLVFIPFIAWSSAYHRQPARHAPPIDVAPAVALTCPRCNSPQSIPANGGECSNCRLQIFIALNEGRCRKCRYPLRGLTSPNCPECGTPIGSLTSPSRQPSRDIPTGS